MRPCFAPLLLVLSTICGCADTPMVDWYTYVPAWGPFQEKNTSGIETPAERIDALVALAERASDLTPDQQERTSGELADSIRRELDPMVRAQIVRTLSALPTQTAFGVLRAGLQDTERDVRVACCQAVGRRGGAEAARLLAGVVTGDSESEVRLAAVKALGEVNDQAAIGALRPALEDSDPAMQYVAVQSMRKVSGREFGNDVNAWRQFAAGGQPEPAGGGIASSLLGWWFE